LLKGTIAAPYEPASLRAQAFTTRLAYKQAITSYIYDWKQLVATIGEHQMPLTEIAGQVDRLIPYYEYDQVLAYALQNHTDILTARNGVKIAQYNLKLAQVTAIPDLDVRLALEKDTALIPFGTYQTLTVGGPLPVWDQNRGNIIAAQGGLARATEESHRVEVALTNNLAGAYANYHNNLIAIEYYRRYILPDLVRYYRGIHARRQVDPNSAFGDLVAAQQNLSTNVTSYLVVLQNTWTSAVGVADFLQTDDLFQLATPRGLPELPDFNRSWPCDHGTVRDGCEYHTSAKSRSTDIGIVDFTTDKNIGLSKLAPQGTVRPVSNRISKSKTRPQAPTVQSERDEAAMPGRQSPDDGPAAGVN
jgi:cobalt-zinc-cadmium efflux system outer membrane protein